MSDFIEQITGALPILCMTHTEGRMDGAAKGSSAAFTKQHAKIRTQNPAAAWLFDTINDAIAFEKARVETLSQEELKQEALIRHRDWFRKENPAFIEALRSPGPQREYWLDRDGQAYVDFMTEVAA